MQRGGRERALLLAGMMGAGKTSVGRLLARRLGRAFIDTDERVAARAGASVAEIFARHGEPRFRELEREVLRELPARDAVVALGGGALIGAENREILREKGIVVWLDARPEVLARRVRDGEGRPLLAGSAPGELEERLGALLAERAPAYERADLRVAADEEPERVCAAVLAALGWGCAA